MAIEYSQFQGLISTATGQEAFNLNMGASRISNTDSVENLGAIYLTQANHNTGEQVAIKVYLYKVSFSNVASPDIDQATKLLIVYN